MKIHVISSSTEAIRYYSRYSFEAIEAYCKKHGYTYHFYDSSIIDGSKHITWSKLNAILHAIDNTDTDYIFWADADSIPVNFDIKLESFIDNDSDIMLWSEGSGINKLTDTMTNYILFNSKVKLPLCTDINSGNFFVKVSDKAKIYLSKLISDNTYMRLWYSQSFYHEESAILYSMLNKNYKDMAKIKISDVSNLFSTNYDTALNKECLFFHQCGRTPYKNLIKCLYDILKHNNIF